MWTTASCIQTSRLSQVVTLKSQRECNSSHLRYSSVANRYHSRIPVSSKDEIPKQQNTLRRPAQQNKIAGAIATELTIGPPSPFHLSKKALKLSKSRSESLTQNPLLKEDARDASEQVTGQQPQRGFDYKQMMAIAAEKGNLMHVLSLWDDAITKQHPSIASPDLWEILKNAEKSSQKNLDDILYSFLTQLFDEKKIPRQDRNAAKRKQLGGSRCFTDRSLKTRLANIRQIFRVMVANKRRPSNSTYNALIKTYARMNEFDEAIQVINESQELGIPSNVYSYTTLLSGYADIVTVDCAETMIKKCRGILETMRQKGIRPLERTYNALMKAYINGGQIDRLPELFEEMSSYDIRPNQISYTTMFGGYAHWMTRDTARKLLESRHDLFSDMDAYGIKPTTHMYNILLKACTIGECIKESLLVLKEMRKSSVRLNVISYATILNASAETADQSTAADKLAKSKQLVDLMRKEKLAPNDGVYSTLLKICAIGGLVEEAVDVIQEMRSYGLRPSVICYTTLMRTYAAQTTPETGAHTLAECRQLMRVMRREGCRPNTRTYATMITLCGNAGFMEEVSSILDEMLREGRRPNAVVYEALIEAYIQSLTPETAKQSFTTCQDLMDSVWQTGQESYAKTYQLLIKLCCRGKLFNEALTVLDEMKSKNVLLGSENYTAILNEFAKSVTEENTEEVLKAGRILLDKIRDESRELDVLACNAFLGICAAGGFVKEAMDLLDAMRKENIQPDGTTFSMLLDACVNRNGPAKAMEKAQELQTLMKTMDIEYNVDTYISLFKLYCLNDMMDKAFGIFDEMHSAGLVITLSEFKAFVELCPSGKGKDYAQKAQEKMEEVGLKYEHTPEMLKEMMRELLIAETT